MTASPDKRYVDGEFEEPVNIDKRLVPVRFRFEDPTSPAFERDLEEFAALVSRHVSDETDDIEIWNRYARGCLAGYNETRFFTVTFRCDDDPEGETGPINSWCWSFFVEGEEVLVSVIPMELNHGFVFKDIERMLRRLRVRRGYLARVDTGETPDVTVQRIDNHFVPVHLNEFNCLKMHPSEIPLTKYNTPCKLCNVMQKCHHHRGW
jgi:hypothetical protein